jgi:hypothetical protein
MSPTFHDVYICLYGELMVLVQGAMVSLIGEKALHPLGSIN